MSKDIVISEEQKKKYAIIEGNLLEYPIFSMQKSRDKTTEEYIWREKDIAGRIMAERRLKVDCVEGIPNFFDMDVFNGIMRIFTKKMGLYKKDEAHFTIYELIREMNLPVHDGMVAKRTWESLKRMAKTSLHFEDAFYKEKEKVTKIVHLLVRIEIYEKQKGDRLINMIKVVLDDELVSSIERKYFNLIDFDVYNSLPSGLPRRLYEYLEKKKYRKDQFEIEIRKLAGRIPLKTRKISQLKELLGKANRELKQKEIIDDWEFKKSNIVYHFKKSERFKRIEKDLFYLETLVRTFYQGIKQMKISGELLNEGMAVLQSLLNEGYSKEEVEYSLGWTVDNIKNLHSIKILPKVIGQALGDKESKELIEEKEELEKQKRAEEIKRVELEREEEGKLDKLFERLPKEEKEEIEGVARKNLIEQGVVPEFILPTMLKIERNKILETKRLK